MKEMNLFGKQNNGQGEENKLPPRADYHSSSGRDDAYDSPPFPTDADAPPPVEQKEEQLGVNMRNDLSSPTLFGTLEIEGDGMYYCFLTQNKNRNVWTLTTTNIFEVPSNKTRECIVAVLASKHTGSLSGYGKTYVLTRLMTHISTLVYLCANNNAVTTGFFVKGEYSSEREDIYFSFESNMSGRSYRKIEMAYEGFKFNINVYNRKPPYTLPELIPVQDEKTKAAVVANLGIKTAATLFKQMGSRLDWYKDKEYTVIDSDVKFKKMMLDFIRSVQRASSENLTVLVGLDTETTGLKMLDLSSENPLRDSIVAIPFAWEDNRAYLICMDMFYFSNVSDELVYPVFSALFSRNHDYTFQDIELEYEGEHFSFNRKNITVAGWNVMFDEQAFFTHDCDVFFDEDGRQLFFNLDTDLWQGEAGAEEWGTPRISNSLKMQTRRMIGHETLELDELLGAKHQDKFKYLVDETLAKLYGGADADYTRLMVKIGRRMTEPSLYAQYRKYDMTTIYRMARAAWSGMPIDSEAVRSQGEMVLQDIKRLQEFIWHYAWLANRDTLSSKVDKVQQLLGLDSTTDVESVLEKDQMFKYAFTPNNHKRLLFDMLGYPVVKMNQKNHTPALDKFVLQKLSGAKRTEPVEVLKEDVRSIADPNVVLIDKEEFNSDAYPLARVFTTYATLNKEYTSYYKPIMEHDNEGKMFYDITLARAATRRILSPGQTMKGSLKSLVIAPPGQIFMSFDASQIEYRHMASLAYIREKKILQEQYPDSWQERLDAETISSIFNLMQKEEADYHIETAASMTGVKQHEVTSKVRKRYKSIGFGIPYGLGERSMCESLHGGVVNDETMADTRQLLSDYKVKQKSIIDLLESTRDSAFVPAPISDELRKYLGVGDHHVGIVRNFVGFYRVFILENLSRSRTGRIRRQAGNCIIQGGAAELFRRMLYNFHVGCCHAGIEDKIHWLMTVHDELDATIDADIDIMLLIKVLYECCTLRYPDHIPYYIGINFGANWEDAKADANELPVIMVQRMIAAYDAGKFSIPSDGNQAQNLLILKRHYLCDRIGEELSRIIPGLGHGHIWTEEETSKVDAQFENYVVRAYLDVFAKKGDTFQQKLEAWQKAREEYGFGHSFLYHNLEPDTLELADMDFDADFDLSIDLLENSSEEEFSSTTEDGDNSWFSEDNLFDATLSSEDIVTDDEELKAKYTYGLQDEDDLLEENPAATNFFEVYTSKKYMRTKVLKVKEDIYSLLLNGTEMGGKEQLLAKIIRKQFGVGAGTVMIIGNAILKVNNVNCSGENLDWLDQIVTGRVQEGVH